MEYAAAEAQAYLDKHKMSSLFEGRTLVLWYPTLGLEQLLRQWQLQGVELGAERRRRRRKRARKSLMTTWGLKMAAGTEYAAEVQAYLDKHKISSLFEDLMSRVVKELPPDPIEFLISKLQLIHRQRKKATSPRPPSTTSSRSKIQVTGIAVPTKSPTKLPTRLPTTGKASSADRLAKSSSNLRPTSSSGKADSAKPKSALTSTSTPALSKTTPTRVHPPTRPTTTTTHPRSSGGPSRTTTTASRTKPAVTTETKRPTTAPTTSKPTPKTTPSRASKIPTGIKTTPGTAASRTAARKPTQEPPKGKEKGVAKPKEEEEKPEKPVKPEKPEKPAVTEEVLDEFFGEAKKSSSQHFQAISDEEEEEEDFRVSERATDGDGDQSDDEGEEGEVGRGVGVGRPPQQEIDWEQLLKKRLGSKQAKKAHHQKLQALLHSPPVATPTSSGYISDEEEEEEGEGVVLMEDYAALEEEGVTGLEKGKYAHREAPPPESATVDLKVLICARCAKIISQEEQATEVSASEVTQVTQLGEGEFESASQVGSHASFPQWEAGSAVGSEVSSVQKWMGTSAVRSPTQRSGDADSDVTLQSHDTWGGLAPQPRPPMPPSDDESELHLPPPSLEGQPWVQDTPPQHDPHGWAQEDTRSD